MSREDIIVNCKSSIHFLALQGNIKKTKGRASPLAALRVITQHDGRGKPRPSSARGLRGKGPVRGCFTPPCCRASYSDGFCLGHTMGCYQIVISGDIVKTLENRYPIFKAGEAAGTSMCRVLSMKSTVRPFHGPWGAYAPQG